MLTSRRTDILRIAARYGIENVRVFGSFARGKNRPDSDLDLLVDLEPGRSLLDIIAAKQVDVVTERSLSPYFRDSVTQEVVYL